MVMPLYRPIAATPPELQFKPFSSAVQQNPTVGDVVTWMRKFAHQGKGDPVIRGLVEDVVRDVAKNAYASEMLACYYWVCANIRYMRDPRALEYVCMPRVVVERRTGDCDDIATLIAAMGMACGNEMAFCICSFASNRVPSHVYAMVRSPAGWLPLDPVANRVTAHMSRVRTWSQVVPV